MKRCIDCGKEISEFAKRCEGCYHKSRIGKKSPINVKGKKNSQWRGGRRKDNDGYILVYSYNHPFKRKDNYVLEHRLVMEKHLGRYLTKKEIVHHKGIQYPVNDIRNKSDNRIKNLEVKTDLHHKQFHNSGEKHPLWGKHHTEETKKKISDSQKLRLKKIVVKTTRR